MNNNYHNIKLCKICGSKELTNVFSLDPQFLSATFVKNNAQEGQLSSIKVPLTLTLCDTNKNPSGCGLLQLREEVDSSLLYDRYFYRSSTNLTMINDLKGVVKDIQKKIKLNDGDVVVDIGANDCTMIQFYPKNLKRIAVEPAKNIEWDKVDPSILIIND